MAIPTAETGHNFNVVTDAQTTPGTTLENLKAAVAGETGASAKYAAFAKAAEEAGFTQIARLFAATSEAEQIHINLETNLIKKVEPDYVGPTPEEIAPEETDLNLIGSANGEIFETSDMYPAFIKVAQQEGDAAAVSVFTRAKLAEAYHAQRYLDAYNTIDNPTDDKYYLCPFCGYIEKGEPTANCPVCGAPADKFKEF